LFFTVLTDTVTIRQNKAISTSKKTGIPRFVFLLCCLYLTSTHTMLSITSFLIYWLFLPLFVLASTLKAKIPSNILEGGENACFQTFYYYVNPNIQFHFCLSQSKEYNRNGRSITELVKGRGYMPTCRVLHLLLWMLQQVNDKYSPAKDYYFIDVGANIGKNSLALSPLFFVFFFLSFFLSVPHTGACSMHLAALGLNVISIEPIEEHLKIINGSLTLNPSFKVDAIFGGISTENRKMKAQLYQQATNWGNSALTEVKPNEAFDMEVDLYAVDSLAKGKTVSILKIDCEGCEYEALLG
jgi:FkbM family methyltransferase